MNALTVSSVLLGASIAGMAFLVASAVMVLKTILDKFTWRAVLLFSMLCVLAIGARLLAAKLAMVWSYLYLFAL